MDSLLSSYVTKYFKLSFHVMVMLKNMWIIGFDLIVWYDIKLCDIYIYI